jgi:hypothetical protein
MTTAISYNMTPILSEAPDPAVVADVLAARNLVGAVATAAGQDEAVLQSAIYQQITVPEVLDLLGIPMPFVSWGYALHNPESSHPRKIDLLICSTPVEVKAYGTFAKAGVLEEALRQVSGYRALLRQAGHAVRRAWATDGRELVEADEAGRIRSRRAFDAAALADLLCAAREETRLVYDGATLSALFAVGPTAPLRVLARRFHDVLAEADATSKDPAHARARLLRQEWLHGFKVGHSKDLIRLKDRREAIGEALSLPDSPLLIRDEEGEYRALFALYTAYAVFVKIAAHEALRGASAEIAARAPTQDVREMLRDIESGRLFREIGLHNVLEGDVFSWYLDFLRHPLYEEMLAAPLRERILPTLTRLYPPASMEVMADSDMFRGVYESLVPGRVRHALGEFFTPLWLAEDTLRRTLADASCQEGWRGIDPACGSGAFLCAMLRHKIAEGRSLRQILHEVAGIDINPLSALTARVNYFLHILPLVAEASARGEIGRHRPAIIPVFLGDTCNLPVLKDGWLETTLPVGDRRHPVRFPAAGLSDPGRLFEAFARFERAVAAGIPAEGEAALAPLLADTPPEQIDQARAAVRDLAALLCSRTDPTPGVVWGRLIANRLALATLRHQHVIVGNPPWVKWNVLPDRYRADLAGKPFTTAIFSDDKHLGGNSLNVCALILFAAVHRFAEPEGTAVGFLMPNDLLFTASHRVWRRFDANDIKLDLRRVVDWSGVRNVFEGVTQPFWAYLFLAQRRHP